MGIFDMLLSVGNKKETTPENETEVAYIDRKRPQDDVPTEQILMYIVKDCQRMLHENCRIVNAGKQTQKEIDRVIAMMDKQKKEQADNPLLRAKVESLEAIIRKKNGEITKLQKENDQWAETYAKMKAENAKLTNKLKDADATIRTMERIKQILK